jgi:DNA modification methylase
MKTLYEDPFVTIYHGDCADLLRSIEGKVAIVSDPPYGIQAGFDRRGTRHQGRGINGGRLGNRGWSRIEGDDRAFDPSPLLQFRWVALFGANHYADKLPAQDPAKPWKWLIWDKRNGSAPDNNSDAELIWTNQTGAARVHYQKWRGIVREGEENLSRGWKLHPAQKPISLMRWVIGQMKLPADVVIVDPYAGSGTTCRAAKDLGYKSIGVELNEEWAQAAVSRMSQESLFSLNV